MSQPPPLIEAPGMGESGTVALRLTGRGRPRVARRHSAAAVSTYGYDAATGELLSVTYDESFDMTNLAYTYDRLGRRATVADAAGSRTFAYDAAALELASETFTSGLFNGLVIKPDHEDGSGGTLEGRWSGLRVGTSGDDDSHYLAQYGYDATGRLSRVTGPGLPAGSGSSHGAFYTFVSDSDLVDQIRYKVDGGDVRAWVARSYEAERDLVTSVENNFGDLTTYTTVSKYAYGNDTLARRTHAVRTGAAFGGTGGSGDHLDLWSYNNRNELTGSDRYADTDPETPEDPVTALNRAYTYDPIGNRVTSEDGATPTEWEYDTNALNQYERVDTVGDALIRQGYTFDADGNLAEQWLIGDATCDGLVNSFDTDWFVAAILDPENSEMPEGYPGDQACWDRRVEWADLDGNGLINTFDIDPFVDVVVSGSAVSRVFTWNAENKLVMASPIQTEEIDPPLGSQRVSFVYDYLGRRVEKRVETWTDDTPDDLWVTTSRTRYVYDGWLLLLELDALDSNAVVRQYTWGLDLAGLNGSIGDRTSAGGIGGLLAVHDETVGGGEDYIYFYDANGNVGQLVALETGYGGATDDDWHTDRLVARYEYDAYGRITGPDTDDDGDWRDDAGPYAETNVMRFSTKPWDDELSWGNWGERLYDPRLGRWMSRDPLEELGGINLYGYCRNTPTSEHDPLGLACKICFRCWLVGAGTISPDGKSRDCEYVCTEIKDAHKGRQSTPNGDGCDGLVEAGLLPPRGQHVITISDTASRSWTEWVAGCGAPPCPQPTQYTCRDFTETATGYDRDCSRATCRGMCRSAKDGAVSCELLKNPYKTACKLAIAVGVDTCVDLCNTWCSQP